MKPLSKKDVMNINGSNANTNFSNPANNTHLMGTPIANVNASTTPSVSNNIPSKRSVRIIDNARSVSPSQMTNMYELGFGEEASILNGKVAQLEKDLERRQESYISRERAYKVRIDELEEELSSHRLQKIGWMKSDEKIKVLKKMQGQILDNVELVQDRTARILQEQERDLLRAFKARLFDVQTELEKEKSKKDDGAAAWIERCRQLESEVEWAKEVADRLERVNQTLLQENGRLKSQFNSQEEDRNFLIKQLIAVKKDNARLRTEYLELEKENDRLVKSQQLNHEKNESANNAMGTTAGSLNSPSNQRVSNAAVTAAGVAGISGTTNSLALNVLGAVSALAGTGGNNVNNIAGMQQLIDSEERYKEVNVRLRRLLAEERKSLQQARTNYAQELKARTEMEMLLRQCVEDVRQEIAKRHVESAQFTANNGSDLAKLYSRQPGMIPIEEFTQEDRERVLELLLSQERVVSLIYAKAFPVSVAQQQQQQITSHNGGKMQDNLLFNHNMYDSVGNTVLNSLSNRPGLLAASDDVISAELPTNRPNTANNALQNGSNSNAAPITGGVPTLGKLPSISGLPGSSQSHTRPRSGGAGIN